MTKNLSNKYLLFIIEVIGLIFLRSSWGKLTGGVFVDSLGVTLSKFAVKNPYPIVADFLNNIAIPNSVIFGQLTMWGEFFTAISLTITALYLLFSSKPNQLINLLLIAGLAVGMFLNGVFWLASGWTSPSTDGLNLLMFLVQLSGLIYGFRLLKT